MIKTQGGLSMKDIIRAEIKKYVLESKNNWSDEPITQFALTDDFLFEEYKVHTI